MIYLPINPIYFYYTMSSPGIWSNDQSHGGVDAGFGYSPFWTPSYRSICKLNLFRRGLFFRFFADWQNDCIYKIIKKGIENYFQSGSK